MIQKRRMLISFLDEQHSFVAVAVAVVVVGKMVQDLDQDHFAKK